LEMAWKVCIEPYSIVMVTDKVKVVFKIMLNFLFFEIGLISYWK
jgi:hypothetical protein